MNPRYRSLATTAVLTASLAGQATSQRLPDEIRDNPLLTVAKQQTPPAAGRIGVTVAEVPDALAAHLGIDADRGILITEVTPDLPAHQAGVRRFDVVTAVNDKPVQSTNALRDAIAEQGAGQPLELSLRRGADRIRLTVTIADPLLDASLNPSTDAYLRQLASALANRPLANAQPWVARTDALLDAARLDPSDLWLRAYAANQWRQSELLSELTDDSSGLTDQLRAARKAAIEAIDDDAARKRVSKMLEDAIHLTERLVDRAHGGLQARDVELGDHAAALHNRAIGGGGGGGGGEWSNVKRGDTRPDERIERIEDRLDRIEALLQKIADR